MKQILNENSCTLFFFGKWHMLGADMNLTYDDLFFAHL